MASSTYGVCCAACQSLAYQTDYSWSGSVTVCFDCGYYVDQDNSMITFRELVSRITRWANTAHLKTDFLELSGITQ